MIRTSFVKASTQAPPGLEEFVRELGVSELATPFDRRFSSGELVMADYLRRVCDIAKGKELPDGWMPQTTFWLAASGRVVASSVLRAELTPALEKRGGHISYYVLASERRKGYGRSILGYTVEEAREAGLREVLITCASSNLGSRRIIEGNGGILAEELYDESGELYRRYRITLAGS